MSDPPWFRNTWGKIFQLLILQTGDTQLSISFHACTLHLEVLGCNSQSSLFAVWTMREQFFITYLPASSIAWHSAKVPCEWNCRPSISFIFLQIKNEPIFECCLIHELLKEVKCHYPSLRQVTEIQSVLIRSFLMVWSKHWLPFGKVSGLMLSTLALAYNCTVPELIWFHLTFREFLAITCIQTMYAN